MRSQKRFILSLLFVVPFFLTFALYSATEYRAKDLQFYPPGKFTIDLLGVLNVWGNGQRNGSWIVVPIEPQTNAIRFQAKNMSFGSAEYPRIGLSVDGVNIVDSVMISSPTFAWYTLKVPVTQDSVVRLFFMNDSFVPDTLDVNFAIDSVRVEYVVSPADTLKGRSVIIRWRKNTEPDLAGYKLYYGNSSRDYRFVRTDVGFDTSAVVKPEYGKTWYLAVTAYDTANNESRYSQEVSFFWLPPDTLKRDTTPPKPPLILKPEAIDSVVIYFK